MGEELQVSGHLASCFADAFGKSLNLAKVRRVEREDDVGLSQPGLFDNYGFRLVSSRFRHFYVLV